MTFCGLIYIAANGKILKNNPTIWSHCPCRNKMELMKTFSLLLARSNVKNVADFDTSVTFVASSKLSSFLSIKFWIFRPLK